MPTFAALFIGFLLGMSYGQQSMLTRAQRRLREFFAAKGLRTIDASGVEVAMDELAGAIRKDMPAEALAPAPRQD